MAHGHRPGSESYWQTIWSRISHGGPTVYLEKADVTDPQVHAQKPYSLTGETYKGEVLMMVGLNLDDLRDLHRSLTDELARVASGGRWPGRGTQRGGRDDRS